MRVLPLSKVKATLSGLVNEIAATDEEVIITKNGRPAAVLVSPEEYEGWQETLAVRGDRALMKEIKAGLAALKSRRAKVFTLDDLLKDGG
jgi:antitoxin YefM